MKQNRPTILQNLKSNNVIKSTYFRSVPYRNTFLVPERVDLNISQHKGKNYNCVMMDVN